MATSPGDVPRRRPGELAWAAGLLEARGTFTTCRGIPRVAVRALDEASLDRFAEAVRFGALYGPYANESAERLDGHARRPRRVWVAEGDAGRAILALLEPWLSAHVLERGRGLFHVESRAA